MNSLIEEPLNQPISCQDLFERFLRLSVNDGSASPRTLKAYREGLGAYFAWCKATEINIDPIEPSRATFDDIQAYRTWLSKNYKHSTASLRLTSVRVLYKSLQRWGNRKDDPSAGVKVARNRTSPATQIISKSLTPEEASLLWNHLFHSKSIMGIRDRAIIALMLWQGLRVSEVSYLTSHEVDPGFSTILIHGKGNKERIIQIAPPTREALMEWSKINIGTSTDFLFYALDDKNLRRLSIRSIERIVNKYMAKLGFKKPGRSAHSLRHTYSVLSVMGGSQREALADSLGHKDMTTTDYYIRAAGILQSNPGSLAWNYANKENQMQETQDKQIATGTGPTGRRITFVERDSQIVVLDESGKKLAFSSNLNSLEAAGFRVNVPENSEARDYKVPANS